MEITIKELEFIEVALRKRLEKFDELHKDYGASLNKTLLKTWEDTRKLHSKICAIQETIKEEISYKKEYSNVNQSLNYVVIIQKD